MYKLLLSSRYLRTRFIALASIISVTLGVATMIVVNSVMSGFATEMRSRIHGLLADIVVETHNKSGEPDFDDAFQPDYHRRLIDEVAGEYIEAMSPTVEMFGMMSFPYAGKTVTQVVNIIGIDPESKSRVGTLTQHLMRYQPKTDEFGTVVGPPDRSPDQIPDFEPSSSAIARRKYLLERISKMNRHIQSHNPGPDEEPVEPRMMHQTEPRESAAIDPELVIDDENTATRSRRTPQRGASADEGSAGDVRNVNNSNDDATSDDGSALVHAAADGDAGEEQAADNNLAADDSIAGDSTGDDANVAADAGNDVNADVAADRAMAAADDRAADAVGEQAAGAKRTAPVEAPDDFGDEASQQPVDQTAPQPARLYVAVGLVSFPSQDHATGKFKTNYTVHAGEDVQISTITAGTPPNPVNFNATLVDFFKSGMSEYDTSLVFMNLSELQRMRGMLTKTPDGHEYGNITTVQIKLKDFADAPEVVKRLKEALPANKYSIRTWEQKQGPLLAAVDVEAAILNVLLFLIIAVAGFGILAIFYMIVVEKTRDIGIMKALGASSGGVMTIFLSYGLALGIVGSGAGVILGLLFVWNINYIEKFLTFVTGQKVFDERIYYFPSIPTHTDPLMVMWVALGAISIAVLASVLPARRAASLQPVRALRYE